MDALSALADTLLTAAESSAVFSAATVKTVTSNGSNPPTVIVRWRGVDVVARCPRTYTPVVGHVVVVFQIGPQLLIHDGY